MKNVTKILIATTIVAFIGVSTYASIHISQTPSLDSLRNQAQEYREREEKARIDREKGEDILQIAIDNQCYQKALALTGIRYSEQKIKATECSKKESEKTNTSGTVTPAISGVPSKGIKQQLHAKTAEQHGMMTGEKISRKSPSMSVEIVTHKDLQGSNYWLAYETAIAQIHKWEGLRLSAYWDHAGYSIGYGTRAKSSTEKISKAEADRRLVSIVKPLLATVQKDFPNLHSEAQGALVSFAYNCNKGYQSVRKNGLSYHGQWCTTASGKKLGGLVKRRAEESKLIFSK